MTVREQIEISEAGILSKYACASVDEVGTKRDRYEEKCPYRTEFQRDRDRILHCNSFRRLKRKTQVFLSPVGDHYRTRLTHTLEVAQIARTISRGMRLNEDLTEAIALGHDLGHSPFGHCGEKTLNDICPHGFKHYEQSLRVVEVVEKKGKGLNLTHAVRNGILCHTNMTADTKEGNIVRLADTIAYINHDIEDSIRAGILRPDDLPRDCVITLGNTKTRRITSLIASVISHGAYDIDFAPDIRKAHEGVGGNVQSHLLHRYHRSCAAVCCTCRKLKSRFFVYRPLNVHRAVFIAFCACFKHFRGGGARIAGYQVETCGYCSAGYCRVAH